MLRQWSLVEHNGNRRGGIAALPGDIHQRDGLRWGFSCTQSTNKIPLSHPQPRLAIRSFWLDSPTIPSRGFTRTGGCALWLDSVRQAFYCKRPLEGEVEMSLSPVTEVDDELEQAGKPAGPCAMVGFGATGDLTMRKVVPALYNLE